MLPKFNSNHYFYASFPLAGFDSSVKFSLTWSPFSYSMTLDAYHIDSVNRCYD